MAGDGGPIEVRAARGDEAMAYVDVFARTFVADPPRRAAWKDEWLARVGPDPIRVAVRGGEVVGGLVLLPLGQWYGGREVSMEGLSAVAVGPEHRATGVGTALVRAVLDELRVRGVALSALYPATYPVYRRAGYELAGLWLTYRVPTRALATREETCTLRRLAADELPLLRELHAERGRRTNGQLGRGAWAWARLLAPPDAEVEAHVVERDGRPQGYVLTHREPEQPNGYEVHVRDVVALTPAAARRVLRHLGDHRSVSRETVLGAGASEALFVHLDEPEVRLDRRREWMLRIVDVERAIEQRGFAPGLTAEIHLAVDDELLAANAGRWVLEVGDGRGRLQRGGRGRVRAHVRGLAAVFTGHLTAEQAACAALLGGTDRDLAALSACFAGPSPWMADSF